MALACLLAFSESGVTVLELFKAALFKVHRHTDGDPTLRLLELLSEPINLVYVCMSVCPSANFPNLSLQTKICGQ